MSGRIIENWIKAYLAYTAPMEAPDTFHFWTAVSTIAGALRRRVWLDMGHFQWTPNFYIIFVAPPGIVSKSTTLNIGMSMLREIKEVKFGPDVVTWQALTQSLAAARVDFPLEGAYIPMSAITISSSELGSFLNPSDREMVDVLVDLWDNRIGSWEKLTKGSGSDIITNPWVNIAACTTPAWIAGNFPDYLIGGGFTSRCVFVFSEKKRRLVPYPFMDMPTQEFRDLRKILMNDLNEIAKMAGAFQLSKGALAFGIQWYDEHYNNVNRELNTSQFAGYLARKQTHIHKLAMILSAADSDSLIIETTHLEVAAKIITSLEQDMPKVFANMGQQGDARNASIILDIVKAYGKIDKRTLFRLCATKMGILEFDNAIGGCIATGFVQVSTDGVQVFYVYIDDTPPKVPERANGSGTGS